jgi:L-amino acid N-acyltransferase YncA
MKHIIRLAQKEDLPGLADVYTLSYNAADISEHWTPDAALKLLEYLYKDQPDLFFVAEADHVVIGAIVATVRPWLDGNHLIEGELFLHPEHQHHGLGVTLVKRLFTTAKEQYNVVAWDTYTHIVHKHPLTWYKKLGFEEIKEWTMITGNVDRVLDTISKLEK